MQKSVNHIFILSLGGGSLTLNGSAISLNSNMNLPMTPLTHHRAPPTTPQIPPRMNANDGSTSEYLLRFFYEAQILSVFKKLNRFLIAYQLENFQTNYLTNWLSEQLTRPTSGKCKNTSSNAA